MDGLNWDRQFALEQAADDEQLLQELIDIFKKSCSDDYQSIKTSIAENDPAKICAAAHSIKGAAASLGIIGIRDIASEIENDSRAGSLASAHDRIDDLDLLLQQLQNL
jgi:HPt (histidine-containing phosphotransfer) domain-containing protein